MSLLNQNIEELSAMLPQLLLLEPQVKAAAEAVAKSLLGGGKLMACGNGGSAADASHLTTEFVCRFDKDRKPYAALSLAAHGGDITAIGNDYSFDDLFARQLAAFGRKGDVLVAFSTTGRSENVRRALLASKQFGVTSIAFLGKGGGACTQLADIELMVPGTSTARIQEGHKLLLHTICDIVEVELQAVE